MITPAFAWDTEPESVASSAERYNVVKQLLLHNGWDLRIESGDPNTGWGWGSIEYYGKSLPDVSQREEARKKRLADVDSPVVGGGKSLNVTVYHDPEPVHGGARSELSTENYIYFRDGDNVWYHWYTLFPEDLVVNNSFHVWTQWHQIPGFSVCRTNVNHTENSDGEQRCPAVPMLFNLRNYPDSRGERIELVIIDKSHPKSPGKILWHKQFNNQDFKKGVWHEFLIHVKWAKCVSMDYTTGTCRDNPQRGFQELWVDRVKQQFIESAHHYNLDDYQDSTITDPTKKAWMEVNAVYMKQGLYHCYCPGTPIQTIYHDGMEFFVCGRDVTRGEILLILGYLPFIPGRTVPYTLVSRIC